jgi:proline iminopeptidase
MRVAVLLSVVALIVGTPCSGESKFNAVQRESGFLDLSGTPHPYIIEGKGDPCLFVGPGTQYAQLLSDRLKQSIRFVFVDFRRTWNAPSGTDLSSVTLQTLVDEVDEVREALHFSKICLAGHSTAGFVALEYAIQHPEHVSHVILMGAPAYQNPDAESRRRAFWDQDASPQRKARYAENLRQMPNETLAKLPPSDSFMFLYKRGDPYYFYDYNYDSSWTNLGHYFSADLAIRFYRAITANYDPRPRLEKNRVPIFSAVGRYDYITPAYLWDGFEKRVPMATVVRFDRSGHFPMFEEQDRFDAAVLRWLKRLGEPGAHRREITFGRS